MTPIPLANILQHKLRSVLTSLGIAIGVCMLITLSGLARGTLFEIADRWESVDADLILMPHGWSGDASTKSGSALESALADVILRERPDLVKRAAPVFLWHTEMGGQDQMAAGVSPEDWSLLTGGREIQEGRMFDPDNRFADWLKHLLTTPLPAGAPDVDTQFANAPYDGLELVIDSRLAKAGGYHVGQKVSLAAHEWTIVGIVPAGGMTRVTMPLRTAQYLAGGIGSFPCTVVFVKLHEGVPIGPAARAISDLTGADAVPLSDYRGSLVRQFGMMFVYVDMVNVIAMGIAFLFTMVMLYTMVLERTREIAILKANGASSTFLIRQVAAEGLLITGMGIVLGISLSLLAAYLIHIYRPFMTVQITIPWILLSAGLAVLGALLSSIYPAWRATRVDIAEALSVE